MAGPKYGNTDSSPVGWADFEAASGASFNELHLELLRRYVDVCNKVLAANRHRFPYRQIWSAGEQAMSGQSVVLVLHEDGPCAHGVVAMGQRAISVELIESCQLPPHYRALPMHSLHMHYVLEVVGEPDRYVADPSLINWDWLRRSM